MKIFQGGRHMSDVHLFISTGRFKSFRDMRKFIDPTYTDDGDEVPSTFMREVGLWQFEPGCIEAIYKQVPTELVDLLAGGFLRGPVAVAGGWRPHRRRGNLCVFT